MRALSLKRSKPSIETHRGRRSSSTICSISRRIAGGRTALDLEPIDAQAFLRGIVESVIPLATSNQIEIQVSAIPDATLVGDVRRLEQVFVNLLGNSLKFTQAGGHISVSARTTGRSLEVRVADDGIGIAPEFLPHVFDRFRQGDGTSTRNHSGLGLGLSIAKQLVDAHSGSIRVESAGSGQGTAFIVTLPVSGHAAETARVVGERTTRHRAAARRCSSAGRRR